MREEIYNGTSEKEIQRVRPLSKKCYSKIFNQGLITREKFILWHKRENQKN